MILFPGISKGRFIVFFSGLCVMFLAIIARLTYFQTASKESLTQEIIKNRQFFRKWKARRGDIIDINGQVLAATQWMVDLGVDPQMVKDAQARSQLITLAAIIKKPLSFVEHRVLEQWTTGKDNEKIPIRWRKLAARLTEDQYDQVKKLKIQGIYGYWKPVRVYPAMSLASHVIGYVTREGISAMGIEKFCDFYLRGQDGWCLSEKNAQRRELRRFRQQAIPPVDGLTVQLTLDSFIQQMAESTIAKLKEEYQATAVSIVISEPKTGNILAMANNPSFDLNQYWKTPLAEQKNHITVDIIEPGSTFKIITVSAAFNEKAVRPSDLFNCRLTVANYRGRDVRLPHDWKPFEILEARGVLSNSSNRGVAQIAMKLGEEKLLEYAKRFGFGKRTGYGVDPESPGILHELKRWDGLTISRFPMGHAVGANLLQIHFATTVLANKGVLMYPRIIKKVFDRKGDTVVEFSPKIKRRVLEPSTAALISEILTQKPASKAFMKDCSVMGKSGTAQKIIDGHYSHSEYISSFTGFFPVNDPQIIMTIIVDSAKSRTTPYGSEVVAPYFKEMAKSLVRYLEIQGK